MIKVAAAAVASLFLVAPSLASAASFANSVDWDGVVNAGLDGDGVVTPGDRTDPDNALGAPDGNFLSLKLGGVAVFGFGTSFDLGANVFEVTFNCGAVVNGLCGSHQESVEVYTGTAYTLDSFDLTGFVFQGTVTNAAAQGGQAVALVNGPFSFLALVDTSPVGGGSFDGFDVDAVSVQAVPVPPAIALLASGLVGLGFLRRRRAA